jgi:hypothetical protein
MRRRSLATATSSAPTLPPDSRDSARFSTTESEYASRAFSTWKSAKTGTTIVEVKVNNAINSNGKHCLVCEFFACMVAIVYRGRLFKAGLA